MAISREVWRRLWRWVVAFAVIGAAAGLVALAPGEATRRLPAAEPSGAAAPPRDGAVRYAVRSSDSYVGYRIAKLGVVPVRGQFGHVEGEIVVDAAVPERSSAAIRVAVASLQSGNERRTQTLLSDDFFDADRHPQMTFASRRVARQPDGTWQVTGDLTIRGITRPVTLPIRMQPSEGVEGPIVVFSGELEIDRTEFGVLGARWSGGRALLADTVAIELALAAEPRGGR